MNQTAARRLHDVIIEMNAAFKRGSGSKALEHGELGADFADVIVRFTGLINDCRDEVMRSKFKGENHYDTLIDRLNGVQKDVLNKLSTRGNEGTQGALVNEIVIERALSVAEQVENALGESTSAVSRQDKISATEALIAEVKEWDMESYAKQSLLIQLNHVSRIIQAADIYSESELRLRVKSIIADFASEFVAMDKKHQTKLEKLVRWGRLTFFTGTTLLGLTSDLSSVAGLLSPPQKMLTKD